MEKPQFEEILSNVPGSFLSKLERIRRFLYLGKASVMVGAGFSRNADAPSHITVKEWAAVGKDIYCRLQNVSAAKPDDLIFKTPMRLASQFAASFGRSELDNLIRDSIPDNSLYPSHLHKMLLSLPWRDVFTTNYDTLLERSCDGLERSYSVITSKEMLLYKKSPRIVKLHGSFPDKTPFLMTEEDFRTYPQKHPEFVNTVRQAMVESVFCLIGFSGDDPNFTSWQGWLRDVMGDYAGPSYLITCDENYDESFKVLMEHRGVDVLNFGEIKGIQNHKIALDFFFTYLDKCDSKWNGYVSYSALSVNIEELAEEFRKVRLSYPGWFVLPRKYYEQFADMEISFPYLESKVNKIEGELKEKILYELDWRADKSLSFKDFDWYRRELEDVVSSYNDRPLSDEAITLGISLLRLYRFHLDKTDAAAGLIERLKREKPRMTCYQVNMFYYVISCNALSNLDYDVAESSLAVWKSLPNCYEGIIYRSLILSELGKTSDAIKLLSDAVEVATHSLTQNSNLTELSLFHSMEALLAFCKKERMPETEKQFSFFDIKNYFFTKMSEPKLNDFEIKRNFGIGSESRSWNLSHGTKKDIFYSYGLLQLYEEYGLPYGTVKGPVDEKLISRVLSNLIGYNLGYSLGVMLRSRSREVTVAYATRSTLSILTQKEADCIAQTFLKKANILAEDERHKLVVTNVLLPFLSRLASSCSQIIVVDIFKFAINAYRKNIFSKPEDLHLIYSDLFSESIQDCFSALFSTDIHKDIHENDFPLPLIGYKYYTPSVREVTVACNGLASSDLRSREFAYYRAEYLLESNISIDNRSKIEKSIREWRFTSDYSRLERHSYLIVSTSSSEKDKYRQLIDDDINRFLKDNYKTNGSSLEITAFAEQLHNMALIANSFGDEQKSLVLNKISDVLNSNFDVYSMDDSIDFLGGVRNFTKAVFDNLKDLVKIICLSGHCEIEPCRRLFRVLERYIPSNLPVRLTMVCLNSVSRTLRNNKMRDIIKEHLYSNNRNAVVDSCDALVAFSTQYGAIQTVIQDMLFYCNNAETDRLIYYLQTLCLIPSDKMSENTQNMLAIMLKQLKARITDQSFSEEQKSDIMHYGVALAASLRDVRHKKIKEAVKVWEEYATSDNIYNDIRQPWYI